MVGQHLWRKDLKTNKYDINAGDYDKEEEKEVKNVNLEHIETSD